MATELAKAYVQIVPSAKGIQGAISDVMNGEARSAGEKSGKTFASGLGGVAKKAIVGLGIGKMIADSIGNASEFETGMAKVNTLFSGTGAEFENLQGQILGLSSTYGMSASMLAEAAYSAESAGVSTENLGAMLESAAKLSIAGFTDVDTALSATAKTMNAYGNAAGSIEDIQKVLIQTQNLGITTVGELGQSLANVTPTAAAMGVGFDQVGASLAQLTAAGVPTAQATTQLRAAMTELGKSGTKADKAFRAAAKGTKYANMSFQDAMKNGADLGDVFGMMQKYADKSGQSMVDLWGSVEAGNAAMNIASDVDKFKKNLAGMSAEADVVGDAYRKMSDTFGTSMNKMKESAKNFMTTLLNGGDISASFDALLGSVGDVATKIGSWLVNGLKTIGQNLPSLVSSLWDFGASLLSSLGEVDWLDLGVTIIEGIIGALGTLGTKLIELVKGAVTGVANGDINFASIGSAIWNGVTSILQVGGDWLKELFEAGKSAVGSIDFGEIGSKISGSIKSVLDAGQGFLKTIFDSGRKAVAGAAAQEWPTVGEAIKTAVNLALNGGKFLSELFRGGAELVKAINWENVGAHAEDLIVKGLDGAATLVSTFSTAAEKLISSIGWEGIGKSAGELVSAGLKAATNLVNAVGNAADRLLTSIGWENIGKSAGGLIKTGLDTAADFVSTIGSSADRLLTGINWEGIGKSAGDAFSKGLGGLGDLLGGVLSGAGSAAEGGGKLVGKAAGWLADTIFGSDMEELNKATETLKQAMTDLEGVLNRGKDDVYKSAQSIGSGIKNGIAENCKSDIIFPIAAAIIEAVINGMNSKMVDLANKVGELCDSVKTKFKSYDDTWKGIGNTHIVGNIEAGIAERISVFTHSCGTLMDMGINEMNSKDWTSVGTNIVDGIVRGANAATSKLTGALTNLAQKALAAAKAALGIKSPSKVMRDQVGRWIPAGIAEGIERYGSVVDGAMDGIAADVSGLRMQNMLLRHGRLAYAGSGAAAAGNGYNQTINVYSPEALTPSEIARQTRIQTQNMVLALRGVKHGTKDQLH